MRRAVAALTGTLLVLLIAPAATARAPVQIRVSDPVSIVLPGE